jgi:CheY-like chemotaxis protein
VEESKKKATVLVVDDLEDNRDLLTQWLERHGYQAVTASSGPEAFEKLSSEAIDLILLDIQMPGMDGFECAPMSGFASRRSYVLRPTLAR